jgi:hypothetical protein
MQCSALACSDKLTFVSGQGALVAVSMRRKSQYSSHVLSADRYWLLVPSGVSCQNCLQNRCCNYPGKPRRTAC